ncbi:MAG: NTP transferase domain-containing protein [Candidatus Heimdallarchaeum aukensis]|uniref:NTP transferase domain-containing protein n=1 Tax=Candidatus Heimdallarchaeum aukensis TaxID=2876573 RepID=A0A9Y1BIG3_9ARCH|nr:MAG: NTP transferase domain-containing protein [Candidatus Heimdallarchaeum aukensis]
MKAVILAAGKGERLRPLTETTPKPMLKLLGKTIIERQFLALAEAGVKEFIVVTNYMEEKIQEHIASIAPPYTSIIFVHQKKVRGTADAFLSVKHYLDEDFFIGLNGDCVYSPQTIEKAVNILKDKKIGLGGRLVKDTHNYGIIQLDDEYPTAIIEKPPKGEIEEGYANIGIYVLPTGIIDILEDMIKQKEISSRGEYEFPTAINKLISYSDYKTALIKVEENDYWFDIGLPWTLLEANQKLLSLCEEEKEGKIEDNVHIEGKVIIKKGAIVRSGAYIQGPVFIDEGADIGPNCYIRKYTYLGKNTRIGNACEVKNSIIYDGTHAGHLSYIGDSIIGENSNFGAGTITANLRLDDRTVKMFIKNERVDSQRRKLGAIIGDNVKTGIGALFMPGVKIGHDTWIGAGTIVNEDVESKMIYYSKPKNIQKGKESNVG